MLSTYLPHRYRADKAFVVDSKGVFSEQIDVVVYDRQYSSFIFQYEGQTIVPTESVYAVFEAKQTIPAGAALNSAPLQVAAIYAAEPRASSFTPSGRSSPFGDTCR